MWDVEVVDNGEGANAPPDKISLVYIFSPVQLPCSNGAVQGDHRPADVPDRAGNIQVR
jgi:hypothetical protein